jgi:hypothetical protein
VAGPALKRSQQGARGGIPRVRDWFDIDVASQYPALRVFGKFLSRSAGKNLGQRGAARTRPTGTAGVRAGLALA